MILSKSTSDLRQNIANKKIDVSALHTSSKKYTWHHSSVRHDDPEHTKHTDLIFLLLPPPNTWPAADLETSAFICRCNLGNINDLVTIGNFKYFLSIVCSFSCKYFPTCYKRRFIWASLITHVHHDVSFTFSIIFWC